MLHSNTSLTTLNTRISFNTLHLNCEAYGSLITRELEHSNCIPRESWNRSSGFACDKDRISSQIYQLRLLYDDKMKDKGKRTNILHLCNRYSPLHCVPILPHLKECRRPRPLIFLALPTCFTSAVLTQSDPSIRWSLLDPPLCSPSWVSSARLVHSSIDLKDCSRDWQNHSYLG